jgi:hypothetical protein
MTPATRRATFAALASLGAACTTDPGSVGQLSAGNDGTAEDTGASSGPADASADASADATADDSGSSDTGSNAKFDLGAAPDVATVECDEDESPIYVLTHTVPAQILSFDPESLEFTPVIDAVTCPETADWTVSSMAIDRQRGAWIEWGALANGEADPYYKRLDRLDLDSGACETDVGELPVTENWGTPLGMAFVSQAEDSANEQLFFVDTGTYLHELAGQASLGRYYDFQPGEGTTFSGVELTGTGGGQLFTIIMNWTPEWDHPCTGDNPCYPTVHIGEVDKQTGAAISNFEVPEVEALGIAPGGFAFAHWGGRFWIFISNEYGPTKVYDYDITTNTAVLAKDDGPDGVVGAGVSTCAPLVFPAG